MREFIADVKAEVNEIGEMRINGIRFVSAKQSVIDELREKGTYDRYIKAIKEEIAKEVKTVERTTIRVSDELINKIFESC